MEDFKKEDKPKINIIKLLTFIIPIVLCIIVFTTVAYIFMNKSTKGVDDVAYIVEEEEIPVTEEVKPIDIAEVPEVATVNTDSKTSDSMRTAEFNGFNATNINKKRDIVRVERWVDKYNDSMFLFGATVYYKDLIFDLNVPYTTYIKLPDNGNVIADIETIMFNDVEAVVSVILRSDTQDILSKAN